MLNDAVCYIDGALQREASESALAQTLKNVNRQISAIGASNDDTAQLIAQQLSLIIDLLPEFITLSGSLANERISAV
ncbi:putative inner membrane efflux protein [Leminorella grimontii ATCC 33999 = DSM 5078]|nr:putative inner membrane efflux protein [Leminorella grimontii ATCC 33999 = DSM 5078]